MVGDHEEVERARQLDGLAGVGGDLFTASEAVGVLGRQARAESTGVQRVRGVQVRVAEQRQRGERAARVGRIAGLGRVYLLELGLVGGAGVGLGNEWVRMW